MKKSRAPTSKGETGRPEGAAPQGGNSNEKQSAWFRIPSHRADPGHHRGHGVRHRGCVQRGGPAPGTAVQALQDEGTVPVSSKMKKAPPRRPGSFCRRPPGRCFLWGKPGAACWRARPGRRDGLPGWGQFRFALRRPRNSPAAHSSVSTLQTSAWEASPVLGEAAAGAAWAEAGTAVAEGAVRQAAVGGAGQRDALGQRLAACAAGLREVGGAALGKDVGGGNGAAAGDGAAAVGGGGVPPAAVGRQNRAFGQGAVYCAKQNNAASSKKSSARGRTRAEKLEHKIKTKLRHHRDSCSSVKYESDNEKLARKLKDLFNEKDKERKAQYVEWLNSCFAYIMPKDADYKGLYDFLMK